MHVLITGNMGYIGPILVRHLRATLPQARLTGFDTGYFAHCLTGAARWPESRVDVQLTGDMREFPQSALEGVDAVVHLAAISNDPMGSRFEQVTTDINATASAELATAAKRAGVRHFVFASSCSMYGFAEGGPRVESDELNPLTAYARSKVATEQALEPLADQAFTITSLRFATACGMSERLRLDLVLNDFVASALATGRIDILSDGSPWRPLIEVRDMARAIGWAIRRDPGDDAFLPINTGSDDWNYQVHQLAEAVADTIGGVSLSINAEAPADKRSYRVSFARYRTLAPADAQPQITLDAAIRTLRDGLQAMQFGDARFRDSALMRLGTLDAHREEQRLDDALRWTRQA